MVRWRGSRSEASEGRKLDQYSVSLTVVIGINRNLAFALGRSIEEWRRIVDSDVLLYVKTQ